MIVLLTHALTLQAFAAPAPNKNDSGSIKERSYSSETESARFSGALPGSGKSERTSIIPGNLTYTVTLQGLSIKTDPSWSDYLNDFLDLSSWDNVVFEPTTDTVISVKTYSNGETQSIESFLKTLKDPRDWVESREPWKKDGILYHCISKDYSYSNKYQSKETFVIGYASNGMGFYLYLNQGRAATNEENEDTFNEMLNSIQLDPEIFFGLEGESVGEEEIASSPYSKLLVATRTYTVGIKADGTVLTTSSAPVGMTRWRDIIEVSGSASHAAGLHIDGTVVAVGENRSGQCEVSDWENIISVAAGSNHTVGLRSDGTVVAVGNNDWGQCNISDWENIVSIDAGGGYTVGLRSDGTVVAVGSDYLGANKVSDWNNIIAISVNQSVTVGLRADGTVVAVGSNTFGQCDVSSWSNIIMISTGGDHTLGLRSDGTVVSAGHTSSGQRDVSSWKNIVAISAGDLHSVGLKSNGSVVSAGDNLFSQCLISEWILFVKGN